MNQKKIRFAVLAHLLVVTFSLSVSFLTYPVAAQSLLLPPQAAAKVEFQTVKASANGRGETLVEWRSTFEINNLGYNVYRSQRGKRIRLNQSVIPGSVFLAGENKPLENHLYSLVDKQSSLDAVYEIEAVLLDHSRPNVLVSTSFDQNAFAASAKNSQKLLATAKDKSFGQREAPAIVETPDGTLSPAPQMQTDPDRQRWVAAQPGLKFAVKTNGLYRVTRAQLAAAGFDTSVPTVNWQLYTNGVEQSLLLTGDGGNGGVLGANGYLEFYGFGVDTLYTDTQIFYLVVGNEPGKRMMVDTGRDRRLRVIAQSFQTVAACRTSVAAQCNRPTLFLSDITNGEMENFFGDVIYNSPLNVTINAPFADPGNAQSVAVEVMIQGFSVNPPTHNFQISLNNTVIGTLSGGGRSLMQASFSVPAALLQNGANVVKINPTVNDSVTLLQSVRLSYARRYSAVADKLLFTTQYSRVSQIDGFTDSSVRVFDVSDQNNVRLTSSNVVASGNNFTAVVATRLPRLMYAVTDAGAMSPAAITANAASDLYNAALNQDLLIVTYKDWRAQADALAAYRRAQGLTVAVANVEDVFDEFSFGAATPVALRALFARAQPHYAVLFGDATHDPRNYLSNTINYIPAMFIDSNYGEIASDEVLGDFAIAPGQQQCARSSGDCVSDFPIGRLSVRNQAQAQTMIDKIASFEQSVAAGETFSRGVLFVNDYANGYDFAASNNALASRLPANTPTQFTSAVANPNSSQIAQTRNEIVSRINQGPFIVGYAGHGSYTGWSYPDMFPSGNAASLTNGNRLSLFLLLTCLNGGFDDFYNDPSMAENLTRNPNGGAAAVWASSGLTVAYGQDLMANHFYDLHRQAAAGARIGDLIKEAKLETNDNDVRASWVLFGDPTLKIK